ncbi:MAG: restriction endonuclease subunit S [Salinivirgaceae bacterium]
MINKVLELFENNQICFYIKSSKVIKNDLRFDPTHYIDDSTITLNTEIRFKKLKNFIFSINEPNLFTRYYCAKEYGLPYISSSEMSEIEPPVNSRFISKELTNNISQYVLKRGQILVSAAGTVGSIVIATKELDGVAGTSDILRINVDMQNNLGFIYTYLTSSYGANELSNLAYGAIIKRVRGKQLEELKTPQIDDNSILKMNELILSALNKRDIANELIQKSRHLVLQYNKLSPLKEAILENIDTANEADIRLVNITEFTSDYRIDAHFYNPLAFSAVKNIITNSADYRTLKNGIAKRDFYLNRFTRTFVGKGFGIPYLAGKDIIKIRPNDVSYLSKSETSGLDAYKMKKGWILMTCSGTLGRTCYIWNNYEDWVGTHDLIRIETEDSFDSGYLSAFLTTEYGYYQALKFKHGSVIDHLTPEQVEQIIVPIPKKSEIKEIGDLVRKAFDLRAEAIKLEDEAQEILTNALTGK